ncbi:precorrin-2 dehydrogenase/sirohydrochlorin ferrochelatase family protein [Pacificimonas sp. ICDLI1SI03]
MRADCRISHEARRWRYGQTLNGQVQALPIFVTVRDRPVLMRGDGDGAGPKRRLLELAGALIVDEPTPATRLAVLAIDDPEEAAEAAAKLRDQGLLVNVVDKPALCDFSFPAIVDRAPVTVAIATNGASATLSKAVRERLEALLPSTLGAVAAAVKAARPAVNAHLTTASARRRFWDALMAPGAALDPLAPVTDPAAAIMGHLAGETGAAPTPYSLKPLSDDPDDLTLRDLRHLSQADRIYVQDGASRLIAERARRDAEVVHFSSDTDIQPTGRCVILYRRI